MSQILINPEELYAEIESLKTAKELISDIMFSIEKDGLSLDTIDQLETLATDLNNLFVMYRNHLDQDVTDLNVVIAEWMRVDASLAGTNLADQ